MKQKERNGVDLFLFDMSQEVEEPRALLHPYMHEGMMSCVYGVSKSGKTTAVAILMAKLLKEDGNMKIAYIDTMHGTMWDKVLIQRIEHVLGRSVTECSNVYVYNFVSKLSASSLRPSIPTIIEAHSPDVIFIDCIEDFLEAGGYDAGESSRLVQSLANICIEKRVHICSVMFDCDHEVATTLLGNCESEFITKHDTNGNGRIIIRGKHFPLQYLKYKRVGTWGLPDITEEVDTEL